MPARCVLAQSSVGGVAVGLPEAVLVAVCRDEGDRRQGQAAGGSKRDSPIAPAHSCLTYLAELERLDPLALNPAHIVAVTARSGKSHDWGTGAWIYLIKDQEATDEAIALDGYANGSGVEGL